MIKRNLGVVITLETKEIDALWSRPTMSVIGQRIFMFNSHEFSRFNSYKSSDWLKDLAYQKLRYFQILKIFN